METAPASIGHNQGPAFVTLDYLQSKYRAILDRARSLAASFQRSPLTVEDDETAGKMADFAKQLSVCIIDMELQRKDEKQPHLDNERTIDGFFKEHRSPLESAKKEIEGRQTLYLRRKEAERRAAELARLKAIEEVRAKEAAGMEPPAPPPPPQPVQPTMARGDYGAATSLRKTIEIEIVNRAELDLEALRPYFTEDHLMAAMKAAARAGIKEIRGARIDANAVKAVTR